MLNGTAITISPAKKSKEAKLKSEKTELLGFSTTSQFQNARSMETEETSGSKLMRLKSLDCKTRNQNSKLVCGKRDRVRNI